MESDTYQEQVDFYKKVIREYEPYPFEEFQRIVSILDGKGHEDDPRIEASFCLRALLDMGFSEDEVNPWKNKH